MHVGLVETVIMTPQGQAMNVGSDEHSWWNVRSAPMSANEADARSPALNSYLGDHRQDELNKPNIVIEARGDQAAAKRSTTRWMAVSAR